MQITFESPSVQSYLQILQSVINRMAANSTGCKTWCITLVSAIAVLVANKGQPQYVWIAIVPIGLFLFLDSYYLGLERRFRSTYNRFIKKLHEGNATVDDVFIVTPGRLRDRLAAIFASMFSLSIWPFYVLLLLMLGVVYEFVLVTPQAGNPAQGQ